MYKRGLLLKMMLSKGVDLKRYSVTLLKRKRGALSIKLNVKRSSLYYILFKNCVKVVP
jgi:hypothetical protein